MSPVFEYMVGEKAFTSDTLRHDSRIAVSHYHATGDDERHDYTSAEGYAR